MQENSNNKSSSLIAGLIVGFIIVLILGGIFVYLSAESKDLVFLLFSIIILLLLLLAFVYYRSKKKNKLVADITKIFEKEFPDYVADNILDQRVNKENLEIAKQIFKYSPIDWIYTYNHITFRQIWELLHCACYIENKLIFNGYIITVPFSLNNNDIYITNNLLNENLIPPNYTAVGTKDEDFDKVFTVYIKDETININELFNEKFLTELLNLQYEIGGCSFYFTNNNLYILIQEQGLFKIDNKDANNILKLQSDLSYITKITKPFL